MRPNYIQELPFTPQILDSYRVDTSWLPVLETYSSVVPKNRMELNWILTPKSSCTLYQETATYATAHRECISSRVSLRWGCSQQQVRTFCCKSSRAYSAVAFAQLATYDSFLQVVSQWPPGPGVPLVPQQPDEELTAMMAEIDPARIEAIITQLVAFGTRNTMSNQTDPLRGIGAARNWIEAQMQTFAATSGGRMTVSV
jgi:hypothetical protein